MFSVDWSDQQTLLVNITNFGLGLLLVLSVAWALIDVCIDLAGKWRRL